MFQHDGGSKKPLCHIRTHARGHRIHPHYVETQEGGVEGGYIAPCLVFQGVLISLPHNPVGLQWTPVDCSPVQSTS